MICLAWSCSPWPQRKSSDAEDRQAVVEVGRSPVESIQVSSGGLEVAAKVVEEEASFVVAAGRGGVVYLPAGRKQAFAQERDSGQACGHVAQAAKLVGQRQNCRALEGLALDDHGRQSGSSERE